MDSKKRIRELLEGMAEKFNFYERRPGKYQLIVPILHEDDDMVDIYLMESPRGEGYIRLCDFGLTLMRLSYTLDMTETRQRILDSVLINNGVQNNAGNLYLDASINMLYESILQFAGCVQKVCNMRYWHRESIHSMFYDDLEHYITTKLKRPEHRDIVYYKKNEIDWDIQDCTRAIELEPDCAEAYYNRGLAYFKKVKITRSIQDINRAVQDYTKAIELKPDYAEAYCNRGLAYREKGEIDWAIRDCTKAIELKPDYAEAYYNRGFAYDEKGEIDWAIQDFTKAIELKPDYAEAYANRGVAYSKKGERDCAVEDWKKAEDLVEKQGLTELLGRIQKLREEIGSGGVS